MRAVLALVLLASVLSGCTPAIPIKDDFATTALVPVGEIPPEFVEFNNYDPRVNALLATQLCATPYQPREDKAIGASAGRIDEAHGRCQTHIPLFGP